MRVFYALWPDDATRAALVRLQTGIHGRIVRSENLHLTLAFLGEQPAESLPALQDVLLHLPPSAFTVTLDCYGFFAKLRIAWVGMRETLPSLITLQQELTARLAAMGHPPETNFKPHVTLARESRPIDGAPQPPIVWRARCVALMHSTHDANGTVYRVLHERLLA